MKNIITLTTDWGNSDNYVALFKAYIYHRNREALVVDISHDVPKYNIEAATYLLKNSFRHFPEGSIHVLDLSFLKEDQENLYLKSKKKSNIECYSKDKLLFKYESHYFLCENNGIISALVDDLDNMEEIVKINPSDTVFQTFEALTYYVEPAAQLAEKHTALSQFGAPYNIDFIEKIILRKPFHRNIDGKETIECSIIYIDSHGNVITNLTREYYESIAKGREKINLNFNGENSKTCLSSSYNDIKCTEMSAFFNTSNHLEIFRKYTPLASFHHICDNNYDIIRIKITFRE